MNAEIMLKELILSVISTINALDANIFTKCQCSIHLLLSEVTLQKLSDIST